VLDVTYYITKKSVDVELIEKRDFSPVNGVFNNKSGSIRPILGENISDPDFLETF